LVYFCFKKSQKIVVSNFIQTPSVNERILPRIKPPSKVTPHRKHVGGEWRVPCTIRDATAIARQSVYWRLKDACQPYYRKLHLSMAASWLSLARQDEAIDNLLASWDMAASVKTDGLGA
jgi:hypothetical protein